MKSTGDTSTTTNTNNIFMSDKNQIFDKVKNRLPMFIINTYCLTITLLYGSDDDNMKSVGVQDMYYFKIYYIFLCMCAIAWDMWHSIRAYTDEITLFSKICFSIISFSISFPLFIITTNLVSFGLPFRVFFNSSKNNILMFYGVAFPFIYFMNVIEDNYWKNNVDKYDVIEDKDDIEKKA